MYFEESQIVNAFDYLMKCKHAKETVEDYVAMPKYFDGPCNPGEVPGITLRAQLLEGGETFHLFVTPYWECCSYRLLQQDYKRILTTGYLVEKVKELFKENFLIEVDNKHRIYSGELLEGFSECDERFCFQ
jgi:hypothetical protein